MVLVHGGSPKAQKKSPRAGPIIARCTQIAFKPDWTRDNKAAPFKRNDRMLDILPIGVVVFPGSGITGNLADKARKLGIPSPITGEAAPSAAFRSDASPGNRRG